MSIRVKLKKLFSTEPETIHESKVEVEVEIPEKTRTDLFNEAVKKEVRKQLLEAIKDNLAEACYNSEELKLLKAAREHFGSAYCGAIAFREWVCANYPDRTLNLRRNVYRGDALLFPVFHLDMFAERLIDDAEI